MKFTTTIGMLIIFMLALGVIFSAFFVTEANADSGDMTTIITPDDTITCIDMGGGFMHCY